ncbi:YaaC family protein [Streptomyces mirabilis]|uniref:YaaC family protein n=1 Tax=Streptomyces mirabilis TaxID=68239 RepID=UPI00369B8F1F
MHTPGGVSLTPYTAAMHQRLLRGMRAAPPGAAARNTLRKQTFCAALEQAEQMFAAAKVTDAMTRPLLVYYGLNQAGRAIAAAASNVPDRDQRPGMPADPWKLTGHGLKIVGGTNAMNGPDIASIPLIEAPGAFPQLAEILDSGSLIAKRPDKTRTVEVTVGQIWDTISDTMGFSLPGPAHLPVLAFEEDTLDEAPFARYGSLSSWPWSRLGVESARLEGIPQHVVKADDQVTALKNFLASYPTLGDVHSIRPDGRIDWDKDSEVLGMTVMRVFWDAPAPVAGQTLPPLADRVATWYRGQHFVFPALGENPKPLHPLLAWWAVLYTLSMLARYEPCAWQKRIDIDDSPEAAAIEHLLEAALDFLPALIRDTISDVS